MPAVVSDTSVINYLAAIGQTELLRAEFGKVFIPPAVWLELHAKPNLPGATAADSAHQSGWFVIQPPKPSRILDQLFADLDPGEAEAIALACELKPATVLLDETDGRAAARRLGLPTIGTVGILAGARQSGRLQTIRPLLDRLMRDFRFRLSREIYDQLVAGDNLH
jgi:predicted nucleic acid-binding protein